MYSTLVVCMCVCTMCIQGVRVCLTDNCANKTMRRENSFAFALTEISMGLLPVYHGLYLNVDYCVIIALWLRRREE